MELLSCFSNCLFFFRQLWLMRTCFLSIVAAAVRNMMLHGIDFLRLSFVLRSLADSNQCLPGQPKIFLHRFFDVFKIVVNDAAKFGILQRSVYAKCLQGTRG